MTLNRIMKEFPETFGLVISELGYYPTGINTEEFEYEFLEWCEVNWVSSDIIAEEMDLMLNL